MTSETWVIFHWCKGVKVVQTCSYSGTSILTAGYVACCIHPWVNGVIPHLLPNEWTLEQNKRGKTPEDECRPILQKEEAAKLYASSFLSVVLSGMLQFVRLLAVKEKIWSPMFFFSLFNFYQNYSRSPDFLAWGLFCLGMSAWKVILKRGFARVNRRG